MKSARTVAFLVLLFGFTFNEWAFRFIFPLEPIDSFLRLVTLVLDLFLLTFICAFLFTSSTVVERTKHLLNKHPKKIAIYIGFFIAFAFAVTMEFSCRFYFKHWYTAPYKEITEWNPVAFEYDSVLGTRPPIDTVISHKYVVNDSLIYDRVYRIDLFGRRVTPQARDDSSSNGFIALTGCSFAFGYGLDERNTLSFYLDSLTGYRGYNYGFYGYGTQQTLAMLQSRTLRNEIAQPNGILIHLFIDDHLSRLIGSRRMMKLWARDFPYYYLEGKQLKRDGSFWSGRFWLSKFYRTISESAFIDLFDIDIPWHTSKAHLKLFAAVLKEAKKEFIDQYPQGEFLVVIGPNSQLSDRIVPVLSQNGIDVLDCSDLLDKDQKRYKIHWTEAHPNEEYYLELADTISKYLVQKNLPSSQ